MKKIVYLLSFMLTVQLGFTQVVKTQKVTTGIKTAIIYLSGAEIHRSKKVNLVKGRNKIIFTNLSSRLNAKSIQVTTNGSVDLLAISNKIDYLTNIKEKPRVKQLKDSLALITQKNNNYNNNREAYSIEKNMLLKNTTFGGNDKGVSVAELKLAADFYRSRIMEINKAISKIDNKIVINNLLLNKINKELNQLNAKVTYPRGEITLLLTSDVARLAKIDLNYIVSGAGWTPTYDIKTKDINQPVNIIYRANVYNNTDIDWKNIKFKLSTGDPTISATQPKLTPWYLNYKNQVNVNYRNKKNYNNVPQSRSSNQGMYQNGQFSEKVSRSNTIYDVEKGTSVVPNQFIEIAVSELSAEFDIKKAYSIPSDNKPYIVDVVEYNVPALFKHYSVPKLDRDAFLLARIPNWQDLNLIEGNANIYFAGTFVGQSYISTRSVSDTLDISLGRDKKVIVTRTKLKDFSLNKTLGSNRKETHAYRVIVKNNRKVPINIEILGQLPVSQDAEIEVDAVEISDAIRNNLTGELKWEYLINPNQNQKIDLTFSVKYPKNKPISVGKKKYKQARFF